MAGQGYGGRSPFSGHAGRDFIAAEAGSEVDNDVDLVDCAKNNKYTFLRN